MGLFEGSAKRESASWFTHVVVGRIQFRFCWLGASFRSLLLGLFHRAVDNMASWLPSEQKRAGKTEARIFLLPSLGSNIPSLLPLVFSLVKAKQISYTWVEEIIQGHEYREAGIIGSHLRSCKIFGYYLRVNLHLLGLKIGRVSRAHQWNNIYLLNHLTGGSSQPCNLLKLENNFISLTSHKPNFIHIFTWSMMECKTFRGHLTLDKWIKCLFFFSFSQVLIHVSIYKMHEMK